MSDPKIVLFEPFPAQQKFINAVFSGAYKYLLFGGSIRSGKSYVCLAILIVLCRIYPNSRWFVIRRDLPTLKRNTLPVFHKLCPTNFLKNFNKGDFIATFKNGSEIHFMAESIQEDPEYNRWRGLEANGFYFEEINECRKNTFLKAIERAGSWKIRKQPPILVLASCNPTHNWVYDIWYKKSVAGLLDAPFYFQQANIFDNPYLDPEYLESLKNLPAEIYRRFVEGSWDAIDDLNQLISWEALHACGRLIDTDDKTQCLGVDVARFGGDRSVWTRLEGPNIKEIISFDKTDVVEVAEKTERIITLNHISADHVCLDAVGLGAGAVDILRKKSYYIIEMRGGDAPKRTGDRTYSFFNLRSQSFWLLAEEIKHSRLGELTDETLKSDLSSLWYFIQQDRKIRIESKEDLKKRLGRSPDFADSLCYANWAKVHSSLYAPMFSTTSQLAKEETHE